ncbi:MAG: hypothetical protein IJV45_07265 [Prevotella sp.]|nr:hypothetical protein [Prevotella sp.]
MKTQHYVKPQCSCWSVELQQIMQASATDRLDFYPEDGVDGSKALSRRQRTVWDDDEDEAEEDY